MTAQIIGHVQLPQVSTKAHNPQKGSKGKGKKVLAQCLGLLEGNTRPVVVLPSGKRRAVNTARMIPTIEMVEIETIPDIADGLSAGPIKIRVKANTEVVGIMTVKTPKVETLEPLEA